MSDEPQIDEQLNSLVKQLKSTTTANNEARKEEKKSEELTPEDLEQFVIKNSGDLINQSLDTLREVKDYVMASGDPDSIGALADLIKASSSALDSLNKIVVQNKRSATTIATKVMDIDSRKAIQDTKEVDPNAITGTRDEVFKKILADAKVIDVDDSDQSDPKTS